MVYNPYATYGMQSLYRPRPVSLYGGMPGMGQRQVNPGKPPDIGELIKAYQEYEKASAAAEAGAKGGGGFGGLLAGGGAGAGAYYGLGGGGGALSASNALGSGSSIFANSGLGSAGGAWGSAASSAPMAMPNPALFDMSLAQAVNTPVTGSLGAGSAGASGAGGLGSAGSVAGSGAGASGAGSASGYAAMTGGPGSLAYWAGPAAFLATAPVWAPALSKVGRKAGKKVGEALGLAGKHNIRIPYNPANAAKSIVINNQLSGLGSLNDKTKADVLNKFRVAGMLPDQFASIDDPIISQTKTDNASKIGFTANQLSQRDKDRLVEKYGKWWRPAAIKPHDWLEILDPYGRSKAGVERINAMKEALTSYDDAVFNQRAMDTIGGSSMSGVVNSPVLQPPQPSRSSTLSPGIGKDGKRIDYSKRR